jgi:hypothetical protein
VLSNYLPLPTVTLYGTLKWHTMFCQKNFCIVAEVMLNNGFASTHLEKYSTPLRHECSCLVLLVAGRRCPSPTERKAIPGVSAVSHWKQTCCMAHDAGIRGTGVQYHVHLPPPKTSRSPDETPSALGLSCPGDVSTCRCGFHGAVACLRLLICTLAVGHTLPFSISCRQ